MKRWGVDGLLFDVRRFDTGAALPLPAGFGCVVGYR